MNDWKQLANNSVQEREWRESIKRFNGDPRLAAQYLPIARTILGGLAQQLRLGGIEYGHRIVNLPDGTRVRVIQNSGINIIEIFTVGYGIVVGKGVLSIFFENGLLYIRTLEPDIRGPEYTNKGYQYVIGKTLDDYFKGEGTPINKTEDSTFYLHNLVFYNGSSFLPTPKDIKDKFPNKNQWVDSYYWQTTNYDDESNNSNEFKNQVRDLFGLIAAESGAYFITPKISVASNYTGLLRLGVSAWLAVGRVPGSGYFINPDGAAIFEATNNICPFQFVNPFNDGLIHDQYYNFWWVRFSGNKVTFRRMTTNKSMAYVIPWLTDSQFSDEDKRKYLMFLLSSMNSDNETDPIEIEDNRLDKIIGEGRAPLYYGWHFNYRDPWKASIVTHRIGPEATTFDFWREATLGTVAFGFKNSEEKEDLLIPYITSVNVIEQDVSYMIPGIHALHYPAVSFWCALAPPDPSGNRVMKPGDRVPLYCFYKQDNELEILYYEFDRTDEVETSSLPSCEEKMCGVDAEYYCETTFLKKNVFGGYYTSTNSMNFKENSYAGSGKKTKDYKKAVKTIETTNESVWFIQSNTYCGEPYFFPPEVQYYIPIGGSIIIKASGYREQEVDFVSTESFTQFCVIPIYDAEALFLGHYIRELLYNRIRTIRTPKESNLGNMVEIYYPDVMVRYGPYGPKWTSISIDYAYYGPPSFDSGAFYVETKILPEIETFSGVTLVVTSRGVFDSSPPELGWYACIGYSVFSPCNGGCGAQANFAVSGGGAYTDHRAHRSVRFIDDYPELSDDLPSSWRWIGDA